IAPSTKALDRALRIDDRPLDARDLDIDPRAQRLVPLRERLRGAIVAAREGSACLVEKSACFEDEARGAALLADTLGSVRAHEGLDRGAKVRSVVGQRILEEAAIAIGWMRVEGCSDRLHVAAQRVEIRERLRTKRMRALEDRASRLRCTGER